ncbi:Ppx/GppA phosphatase family protein [Methanolobus bombayensis]|uniref:Ppx/GppA phosphatase family protein n=1 Tax=Methanolobus bombayensis TaxID=38023 RepID=UPI001AE1E0DA|nr:exopolyphosphatase [Methanolobus bombayensis]MBP1909879.1 exopolyphosphatase/guanosine-5'-triphosphate,3'-diphosphate pyrophosphatase [Methanolobus bombayensis]
MKFAAIDIGSNAVRLLLSKVDSEGIEPVYEKVSFIRMPIRLGEDAFIHNNIPPEKVSRLLKTMMGFKYLMDAYEPLDYMACATSAMREADNSDEIVAKIKEKSGIDLNVISGRKEAKIIYSNRIEKIIGNGNSTYLHIDVGGGSTEIILFKGKKVFAYRSFNIGTIRMLEGIVTKDDWNEMKKWVKKVTNEHKPDYAIGSGGNINKLYRMSGRKDGTLLMRKDIKELKKYLKGFTLEQRITKLGLRPDRADVIVPASRIYHSVMKWSDIGYMHVPKLGLAEGIVHVLYKKHMDNYIN